MQVIEIEGYTARVSARGVERMVNLLMLQDTGLAVGDYIISHLGYATQKISEAEARSAWLLLDEILAVTEGPP